MARGSDFGVRISNGLHWTDVGSEIWNRSFEG